ncbi:MAG: hypothetical protein DMG82_28525 [Acidobacteria bacterium]|nr:MAG: hypothetical protein DMG82_28525 [Acidobacteriota bacterium]
MDTEGDDRPLLIFDGDCGFCREWVEYWKRLTDKRVRYAAFQEVGEQFPQMSRDCLRRQTDPAGWRGAQRGVRGINGPGVHSR